MTKQETAKQDPWERRALLLHLGDVLETVFCLSQCADEYASIGDAVKGNDALAGFSWLAFIDERMTPRDFIRRASGAFFVWPKALLDETLNRPMLANTVRHDLFADNAKGWNAYVEERRREVPWFGEDLPQLAKSAAPAHEAKPSPTPQKHKDEPATDTPSRYSTWPWPDKSDDA
ncbi:hypothetical protein AWB79_03257 [Caballeronia hypogeia]|uniref:Uncharacterized protein n=1 Tax=Caballeronia hypogeia TaxID=1777140 RepID=A0A158B6N3_9BURK|nr:hypothetical protein [Caballeronia hypogeia]SAK65741.1 hypothetical protein AWB79_03257 [Caballeronia hypogeia]